MNITCENTWLTTAEQENNSSENRRADFIIIYSAVASQSQIRTAELGCIWQRCSCTHGFYY